MSWKRMWMAIRRRTGRYYCPACQRRLRAFAPLPSYYQSNYERYGWAYRSAETLSIDTYACTLCGASDRDRLCALYLRDRLVGADSRPLRILDIAPSEPLHKLFGGLVASSRRRITYRTADLTREDVDDKVDITDMVAYGDGSFDLFLCSHVLEHVADDRRALGELYRILSPGGFGIILVPILLSLDAIDEDPGLTDVAERWRRFGQDDHVRCYSKAGFLERLAEAGFRTRSLGIDHFGAATFTRVGISPRSVLYVVEK